MIKKWHNTMAEQMAEMLEVSDEKILQHSYGEVFQEEEDEENLTGTLLDPEIFGNLPKDCKTATTDQGIERMGHIRLPFPVVNIQYVRGTKPVMARRLEISQGELERIIYRQDFLYGEKRITSKEFLALPEEDQKHYLTGAEAIEKMLEEKEVKDREFMVLRVLPVVPLCMRFLHTDRGFFSNSLEHLYRRILIRDRRYQRLNNVKAPLIIMENEAWVLQEYVDSLINNGCRGFVAKNPYSGYPHESLTELSQVICEDSRPKHRMPEEKVPVAVFMEKAETWNVHNQTFEDGKSYAMDDPSVIKNEALRQDMLEELRPFIHAYVLENYKNHVAFLDLITSYCINNVSSVMESVFMEAREFHHWEGYKPEDPKNVEYFTDAVRDMERGMAKIVDYYIKKQLRYEAV